MERVERENGWLLKRLSLYLNRTPCAVTPEMMAQMTALGLPKQEAFSMLLAAFLGLDLEKAADRALYGQVFPEMVHFLDAGQVAGDPYYRKIRVSQARLGRWELTRRAYAPYEAFVCDDLQVRGDGRVIPQIGFFDARLEYPAVLEGGREWMTVTPNEIATMRPAVQAAQGRVLAYGLGLGYFAFMASEKEQVTAVTVVERDASVIDLFRRELLPQFPRRDKIELICADAFDFARTRMGAGRYDLVFTDLWHDPSDGVPLYRRMKALEGESPGSRFVYWIEKTLAYYL